MDRLHSFLQMCIALPTAHRPLTRPRISHFQRFSCVSATVAYCSACVAFIVLMLMETPARGGEVSAGVHERVPLWVKSGGMAGVFLNRP